MKGEILKREIYHIYDIILKTILLVYGDEFLKFIGEKRSLKKVLKTEIITKKGRTLYLDYLCMLEDGTLLHIEFQFTAVSEEDLERFFDYNIFSQTEHDSLCDTVIISFRTQLAGKKILKIGKTKTTHPNFIYLGDIDFNKVLNNITDKVKNNSKLTGNDEILLMLMCLVPKNKNKVEILTKICKMLKKEELFDKTKIDTFKGVISLEIQNLLSKVEQKKLKGKIKLTPETKELINNAISEVGRKYRYLEKQELIEEGMKKGMKKGKKEEKEEIAKNLKDILPDEEIAKYTGLDLKTVQKI